MRAASGMDTELKFPTELIGDANMREVIEGCLWKSPVRRFGSRIGAEEIMEHKWFSKNSFMDLALQRTKISWDACEPQGAAPCEPNFQQRKGNRILVG